MNDEITFDNESGKKIKYSEMTPSSQKKKFKKYENILY